MAETKGVVVAKCPNCSAPIRDDHPFTWCSKCDKKLPEEIKRLIPHLSQPQSAPTRSAVPSNPSASNVGSTNSDLSRQLSSRVQPNASASLITALKFIGWGNMIASIILAIYILANSNSSYSQQETNSIKFGLAVAIIVEGIIVLIFCSAISRILEYVADIRSQLAANR